MMVRKELGLLPLFVAASTLGIRRAAFTSGYFERGLGFVPLTLRLAIGWRFFVRSTSTHSLGARGVNGVRAQRS